jgi:hypothetical protein
VRVWTVRNMSGDKLHTARIGRAPDRHTDGEVDVVASSDPPQTMYVQPPLISA